MKKIGQRIAVGVAAFALVTGMATAAEASSTPLSAPSATCSVQSEQALQCRIVTADSLTLWNAPCGGNDVGTWTWGQPFTVLALEGCNRYRTTTGSGAVVWVSADPRWSVPC
jgi:hypothetical protein